MIQLGVNTTGNVFFQARDDVPTNSSIVDGTNRVGQVFVASGRRVSGTRVLRINGVQSGTDSTALGTSTINTATVGAGVTTTTTEYMNGNIGPVIAIKGTITDADLLTLERFVASLTPNAPSF